MNEQIRLCLELCEMSHQQNAFEYDAMTTLGFKPGMMSISADGRKYLNEDVQAAWLAYEYQPLIPD